jgi:hypothetical protein
MSAETANFEPEPPHAHDLYFIDGIEIPDELPAKPHSAEDTAHEEQTEHEALTALHEFMNSHGTPVHEVLPANLKGFTENAYAFVRKICDATNAKRVEEQRTTFPLVKDTQLKQELRTIFERHMDDAYSNDSVRQHHVQAELAHSQSIARERSQVFPEIFLTEELSRILRHEGHHTAADGMQLLLAAYGRRFADATGNFTGSFNPSLIKHGVRQDYEHPIAYDGTWH